MPCILELQRVGKTQSGVQKKRNPAKVYFWRFGYCGENSFKKCTENWSKGERPHNSVIDTFSCKRWWHGSRSEKVSDVRSVRGCPIGHALAPNKRIEPNGVRGYERVNRSEERRVGIECGYR